MKYKLLTGLLVIYATNTWAAQPNLLDRQQSSVESSYESTTDQYLPPKPPQHIESSEVDTTGVWYHLRQGKHNKALAELKRLQATYPGWLPPADLLAALEAKPAGKKTIPPAPVMDQQASAYAIEMGRLANKSPEQLVNLSAARLSEAAEQTQAGQHAEQALLLAWIYMQRNEPNLAIPLFELAPQEENSIYGQVLAWRAQENYKQAQKLACKEELRSERLAENCESLTSKLAWSAFEAEDYQLALINFESLLNKSPTNQDYAWGWQASQKRLNALALQEDPKKVVAQPLHLTVASQAFNQAWGRKQFDLAQQIQPTASLKGLEAWQVSTGLKARLKKGDQGQARLSHYQAYISATKRWQALRLGVALRMDHLASGRPLPATDFGSQPDQTTYRKALASTKGYSPEISARYEREGLTLQGKFFTLQEAEAQTNKPYGQLESHWYPKFGFVAVSLFHLPVEDSLLARQGALDPASNKVWGQVGDQGGGFLLAVPVNNQASIAVNTTLASQKGKQVADNRRKALRLDFNYDLSKRVSKVELDYLRIGPFVSWVAWDKNLSHFTLGQGGYYSPQKLLRAGLQFDLLTAEAKGWQVRVKGSLSWNKAEEASVARYPLNKTGQFYASSTSNGPGGDFMLEGVKLVTEHFLVGGYLGYAAADDYQDARFGLVVRMPLSSRHSVISHDLPLTEVAGF